METDPRAAKSLLVKGSTYALSSGLSQVVMFAAWSVLPWMVPASALGQFALLTFLTELIARFVILGTDAAIVRFYVDESRQAQVLRAAAVWVGAGTCVAGIVIWATRSLVPHLVPGVQQIYAGLYPLVFATATGAALAALVQAHFIGLGNARTFGRVTVLKSLITAVGFVLAGWLGRGVAGLLLAQLAGNLIVIAAFIASTPNRLVVAHVPRAVVAEVGVYGLPMTGYAAISLLSDYTGRLVLDRTAMLAVLGVYQFYFQIAVQANGLWGSLNKAWSPHLFGRLERDRVGALRETTRMVSILPSAYATGLAVLLLSMALGIPQRLLPEAYASQVQLFGLLLLGPLYTCIYTAIYPRLYFDRNTVRVSLVQSVLSVVTMAATVLFTVKFGALGAALGWVLGAFLTPIFYLGTAPAIARELPAVLPMHVVWGVVGAAVWVSVVVSGSSLLGAAVLLAGGVGVAWRWWYAPAQPAEL